MYEDIHHTKNMPGHVLPDLPTPSSLLPSFYSPSTYRALDGLAIKLPDVEPLGHAHGQGQGEGEDAERCRMLRHG